jgi:hypothetical protein
MLAGVMFPLWPSSMRVGVWYLSIGLLGLIGAFFGLAIIRLILWCITIFTVKPGIWIFPNLFEDVGFVSWLPNRETRCEKGLTWHLILYNLGRLIYSPVGLGRASTSQEGESQERQRCSRRRKGRSRGE